MSPRTRHASPHGNRTPAWATALILLPLTVSAAAACGPSHSKPAGSHLNSDFRSAAANPTTSANLSHDKGQAKALIAKCIPGTPVQQLRTVHLLLFTSEHGPSGQQVTATRSKVFSCMGVPADQRANFKNAALTDAEHAHLNTTQGSATYFEVTLPALLQQYQAKS